MCLPALAALPGIMGGLAGAGAAGGAGGIFSGLSGLATAAQVGAGVVGATAAVSNGMAANAAAKATARQQDAAAAESMRAGEEESDRQRRAGAAILSQQRIAMAANGVDVGSTAAIETLDATRQNIEDDAFAIRRTAAGQATGYSQQAANSRVQGRNARSAGMFEAAGTLLSTGAKVGAKYASWQRAAQAGYA